jgi:integrase
VPIHKYKRKGITQFRVDEWLPLPNGQRTRFRKGRIPTREQAEALLAKRRAEAFEGRYFDSPKAVLLTVAEAWKAWEPVSKRDNDSHATTTGRAAHLKRHLGDRRCSLLTVADVDAYRTARLNEVTQRKAPPSSATLDREVALLKRCLSYAVECGKLRVNPLAGVPLLNKPNVRRTVLGEADFDRLLDKAADHIKAMLLVAFDTGMRKTEVVRLRRTQLDLKRGCVELHAADTKAEEARVVYLQARTLAALKAIPVRLGSPYVFTNPNGKPWNTLPRRAFKSACDAAGLQDVWVHDLRRSFVTHARRAGVPESVVMRMSGHKTAAVFRRYNIVEDEDLKAAVQRIEIARSRSPESDTVSKK